MAKVNSWGRLTNLDHDVVYLYDREKIQDQIYFRGESGLAYGMGRSYGDSCLNPNKFLWNTTQLNRFISFDKESGRIICESGVLLRDIQQLAVKHGWMLAVTPGTQMITIGGAIANDVHGKNHHKMGNFGDHILAMEVVRTNGQKIECGPNTNNNFFWATVGGLGLTGLITKIEIQLRKVSSECLEIEMIPYESLDEFIALSSNSEMEWEYTVSWFDCLSKRGERGIFIRGNHSDIKSPLSQKNKHKSFPFIPPISVINRLTLPIINSAYFHFQKLRSGVSLTHYEPFFYPLDNLRKWNRIYGPKGFYQYQFVVPREEAKETIILVLNEIKRSGEGSFLSVLKSFGNKESKGMLSFPMPGITLAVDFPNSGSTTTALLDKLDYIVMEAGGRIYPAKDARMQKKLFQSGYSRLEDFLGYRDPGISSALSRRLMGY